MADKLLPSSFLHMLVALPKSAHLWVAYSGGCDSHVLLHLLHQLQLILQLPLKLSAIHVNHGLSPYAGEWAEHCARVCAELDIPIRILEVNAKAKAGQSPEEAARHARYQAIDAQLAAGEYLCTAHHQDDQAETLLLQLLRGAGPKGLAAMGVQSPLGRATQLRPLLNLSREQIQQYAEEANLQWVDDHSNSDTRFDRNYLRHEILPRLKQRWPAAARTISRSAEHCAQAAGLLEQRAEEDWQQCRGQTGPLDTCLDVMKIATMQMLPLARQKNLLRYWVVLNGLPLPSEIKLHHIINDVMGAAEDRVPCVAWSGAEVRRYQGHLYIMRPLLPFDTNIVIPWKTMAQPLLLPDGRTLVLESVQQQLGVSGRLLQQGDVTIRFRQGGETLLLPNSAHHKTLKQLLQERGVPSWQRDRLPLLYVGEQLMVVVGVCLTQAALATPSEEGGAVLLR